MEKIKDKFTDLPPATVFIGHRMPEHIWCGTKNGLPVELKPVSLLDELCDWMRHLKIEGYLKNK